MKIGLVCPYNVNRGGGVQEIVREMYLELKKRGHDVKILTPQPRDTSNVDTTDTIFLGAGADVKMLAAKTLPTYSVSLDTDIIDQVLEQENFDILHFHEPWVPVLSRQILSRSKAVNIATSHASIPTALMSRTVVKVFNPYTQTILKYLHEFTAVSDAAAAYIRSLTDQPIQIIPNGINLKRYTWHDHPPSQSGDAKTILYLGRLEQRKGVKYLLRAFALLQQKYPDYRLILAGDGPDREKLQLLAEDLQLKNYEFLGYVSEAQKMELLATADLYCSPAIYGESFGIVLLESMASGTIAVAGNNDGYAAVMDGIGQMSVVNPRDDAEFARTLALLLNEPQLQKVWLDWAKQYVKQFNYPRVVDQYEQLYKDALKKHRKQTEA